MQPVDTRLDTNNNPKVLCISQKETVIYIYAVLHSVNLFNEYRANMPFF